MLGSSLIDNFLLTMRGPQMGYHVLQRFTKETLESLHISSLRIGRTRHVPDSSNHSLYLIKLFNSSSPGETAGGTSCEMVRLVFRPIPEYNERFARQYREPPPEFSPDFALLRLSSPSFKSRPVCLIQITFKITLERNAWCLCGVCVEYVVCVCLSVVCRGTSAHVCTYVNVKSHCV